MFVLITYDINAEIEQDYHSTVISEKKAIELTRSMGVMLSNSCEFIKEV